MERYTQTADFIRQRLSDFKPEILLVLGSGLGGLSDEIQNVIEIPYGEIPHFAKSTAPGHKGKLVCGIVSGKCVIAMCGRFHSYEGYSYEEITFPIRVARLLGVKSMVVTNASGGINLDYNPGDIMLITDHIKLSGYSPLMGANEGEFGPRFPDMTYAYCKRLQKLAKESAQKLNIPLQEGVYYFAQGPQYETPAEIRAMRSLGADAVGMSTVPEVIVAVHCGMEVLGFSLITNMASGVTQTPLNGDEVIIRAEKSMTVLSSLLKDCIKIM